MGKHKLKWDEESKQQLQSLLRSGMTLEEVAALYCTTKQNISLIIKKHLPTMTRDDFGASMRKKIKYEEKVEHIKRTYGRDTWRISSDLELAHRSFYIRKRQNSKRSKWGWNIDYEDIAFPRYCPVLGVELDYFAEVRQENSPSLDRIDNTKGYEKGNVAIISWRANRVKNDGTLQEHQQIVDWLQSLQP